MRETKFRYTVKRDNGHIFSGVFELAAIESGEVRKWWETNFIGIAQVRKDQFIGLKDCKGIEIYEGDILRHEQHIGKVVWDYSGFMLEVNHVIYAIWRGCEVLGNVFQNPELLERE